MKWEETIYEMEQREDELYAKLCELHKRKLTPEVEKEIEEAELELEQISIEHSLLGNAF